MIKFQTMRKIITKIPGLIPPPPKTEIDGKLENLSSKTIVELIELRDRQMKLLNNKTFISILADKGEKIKLLLNKIISELKIKQEEKSTCELFNKMKLTSHVDKDSVQNVEWEGKLKQNDHNDLDSDDDSDCEDVLHILSQNTTHEKKIKVLPPEKLLVTPQDLLNIEEIPHVKYIVEKTENNIQPQSKGTFKPFKTTKSDVHDPKKEILRKKNKFWEVTAATPPPMVHAPAKVLTIEESLTLQREQNVQLRKIEIQHAAERLLSRTGLRMHKLPEDTSKFGQYRSADSDESHSEESDPEGSDKEVYDEEHERGGVVFTVMK